MAKRKKLECRSCLTPLSSQDSPLDFAAAKRGLCPECYIDSVEANLMVDHIRRMRECEHFWSDWDAVATLVEDPVDGKLFHRVCLLCKLQATAIGPVPPATPDSLDISWCDLDRTTPEP